MNKINKTIISKTMMT